MIKTIVQSIAIGGVSAISLRDEETQCGLTKYTVSEFATLMN